MPSVEEMGTLLWRMRADSSEFARGFHEAQSVAQRSFDSMLHFGEAASLGIVAAIAAISAVAVHEFAKFDDTMARSLLRMRGNQEGMRKELGDTARKIAVEGNTSAEELAAAYGQLAMAGLNAAQSQKALAVAEEFAEAAMIKADVAAKSLASAQLVLGLQSKDPVENMQRMTELSDVLARGSQFANATLEQLAGTVANSGRLFAELNGGYKEGIAIIAAYTQKGIEAGDAQGKLMLMLRTLQGSVISNRDVWQQLGITLYDAAGKMRPLAEVIRQFEQRIAPLPAEEKAAALEMLGFQGRTKDAVTSLFGMSGEIERITASLDDAKGAAHTMAEEMGKTWSAQWDHFKNQITEVFLTIGEKLTPVLTALNNVLKTNAENVGGYRTELNELADVFKTVLAFAVATAVTVFQGWMLVVKQGQVLILEYERSIMVMAAGVIDSLNLMVQTAIGQFNRLVDAYNNTVGKVTKTKIDLFQFTPLTDASIKLHDWADTLKTSAEETQGELNAMLDQGTAFSNFYKELGKVEEHLQGVNTAAHEANIQVNEFHRGSSRVVPVVDALSISMLKLQQLIKAPWEAAIPDVEKYHKLLEAGRITLNEYLQALDKLGVSEGMKDSFQDVALKIEDMNKRMARFPELAQSGTDAINKLLHESDPNTFGTHTLSGGKFAGAADLIAAPTGIEGVDQLNQMAIQEQQAKEHHDRMRDIILQSTRITEDQRIQILTKMEAQFNAQQQRFNAQRNLLLLGSMQSAFDAMANTMAEGFGKQSGAYKAAFVAAKAFAIAKAVINIQQGISEAIALGWPLMIPAIASVVAESAGIISNIQSAAMSFEGGGRTPSGPRSGGVDGRGGFMAVLHPDEEVTDLTRTDQRGGGNVVNIYQTFTGGVTEADLARRANTIKQETLSAGLEMNERGGNYRARNQH